MIKAILFDLDGTLLDHRQQRRPWGEVILPHQQNILRFIQQTHPDLPEEEYWRVLELVRAKAFQEAKDTLRCPHVGAIFYDTLVQLGIPPTEVDRDQLVQAYDWKSPAGIVTYSDVLPALRTIQERGIPTGIITNSFEPMVMRDVELVHHGLLDFFPTCRIASAEVGYLKPHEAIFRTALACVGVAPHEAVFVGDDVVNDIGGAKGVGMRTVLRLNEKNYDAKDHGGADAVVETLKGLLEVIEKW